ncbi:MAG: S9 family peptidase [Pseudoxanthomonas sp.]
MTGGVCIMYRHWSKTKNLTLKMAAVVVVAFATMTPAHAQVSLDNYIKKDDFNDIKMSPDGQYLAATVPLEDRTVLAVLRRTDSKLMASVALGKNNHVADFFWVNKERLLLSVSQKLGELEEPQLTGEILALNFDSKAAELLMGYRAGEKQTGTRIPSKKDESVAAIDVAPIPGDDRNVIVTVTPYGENEKWHRANRLDVYSGRQTLVARAPVKAASFHLDTKGVVRFALGADYDNVSMLYHRDNDLSEWKLINDESVTKRREVPVGFSQDNRVAYLQVEQPSGPDAIIAYDTVSGERKELLRDKFSDPSRVIEKFGASRAAAGVMYFDGHPHASFFDADGSEASIYRMLETSFPGEAAMVTSTTADGKIALVSTYSDRDPGSFYLLDIEAKKASYLLSRRRWIDPVQMAHTKPVQIKARDGVEMRGYLTLPIGKDEHELPLVVYPHGGPFGVYDTWGFDTEVQILAASGYAVLQVNYRGSGNYGRSFQQSGAMQWGLRMQDDVTDATRWAIDNGIADRNKICIYGASYGAYASLMGVAKEPDLYQCAAGYVGVYDLVTLSAQDSRESKRIETWTSEWVGKGESLASVSPNRIVERIKVPVFMAAGGQDETAPIAQTEKMESALRKAGVSVETLYYSTEGHGFYTTEHQREFYTRLLAFLDRHIGKGASK